MFTCCHPLHRTDFMRQHQYTLLAKLGFQDHDKRNPLHDSACAYLRQRSVFERIQVHFSPPKVVTDLKWSVIAHDNDVQKICFPESSFRFKPEQHHIEKVQSMIELFDVQNEYAIHEISTEKPVSKGSNEYKTTIGFLDVFGRFQHNYSYLWRLKSDHSVHGEIKGFKRFNLIFEVKTHLTVSDFLRQIKLYKDYVQHSTGVLVTTMPIDEYSSRIIRGEGIHIIRLSEAFEKWRQEQRAAGKRFVEVPVF